MSLLVIGLSHRSATTDVLESASIPSERVAEVLDMLHSSESINEAALLSTCNRVEVYVESTTFHGGVDDVTAVFGKITGLGREDLRDHLYVHHDARAIAHIFNVACGLDSMVVGESQILGQLRNAHNVAREQSAIGRILGELLSHALRVGKRAHSETGIDRHGQSLVAAALDMATGTADGSALVIGAGSTGALAATTLERRGVTAIDVANRSADAGARLAATTGGRAFSLDQLATALADVDLVVTATGASGYVVTHDLVSAAMAGRASRPLTVIDLALPRDVEPGVGELPGVTVIDLDVIRASHAVFAADGDVDAVREIVASEVTGFLTWQQAQSVAPTVVALRSKAEAVVRDEVARLFSRQPELSEPQRDAVEQTVRRVVEKLLHSPTVRVKQLSSDASGADYATALRELFELEPEVVESVSTVFPGEGA